MTSSDLGLLADTSVWVEFLRSDDDHLRRELTDGDVLMHPWVRGELAMGNLHDRSRTLGWLDRMARPRVASDLEIARLVESGALHGRGIGFVDAGLLASTLITPNSALWTHDRRLAEVADALGVGHVEVS